MRLSVLYSVERIQRVHLKGFVMLVVSRKPGECIHIGEGISVTVVEIKGSKIRLGVTAGKETTVLRGEIFDSTKDRANKVA